MRCALPQNNCNTQNSFRKGFFMINSAFYL